MEFMSITIRIPAISFEDFAKDYLAYAPMPNQDTATLEEKRIWIQNNTKDHLRECRRIGAMKIFEDGITQRNEEDRRNRQEPPDDIR